MASLPASETLRFIGKVKDGIRVHDGFIDAEIEQHSVNGVGIDRTEQAFQLVMIAVDGDKRITKVNQPLPRHLEGLGIAVDTDDATAGGHRLEQHLGVSTQAQRGIHDDIALAWRE